MSTRCKLIATLTIILTLVAGCGGAEPSATPIEAALEPTATPIPTMIAAPTQSPPDQAAPWPTEEWQYSTPIDQGMSIRTLNEFFDAVNRYVDSVLVIRNGYIVFEQNSANFVIDSKHHLFSATKSVLSMLIGIAIDKGYIKGVDQRVLDFFPDRTILNLDERKEALTLKHLLTMSSGFDCPDLGNETVGQLMGSWDWDQFALDLPMSGNPGDSYQYCNANTHLLSTILTKATGMSALDFAHEHLFGPLGITDVRWDSDHSDRGRSIGFTGLWMSPQDLAKLGLLYLEGGVWEDEQDEAGNTIVETRGRL